MVTDKLESLKVAQMHGCVDDGVCVMLCMRFVILFVMMCTILCVMLCGDDVV